MTISDGTFSLCDMCLLGPAIYLIVCMINTELNDLKKILFEKICSFC